MPIGFWSVILGAMCVISCGEKQKRSFNAFDTYLQFYQEVNDSLSKNPRYVCAEAQKRMTATTDSTTYYHYVMLLAKAYMFRSDMDSAAVMHESGRSLLPPQRTHASNIRFVCRYL